MTRHFAGRICEGTCSGRLRKERRGWSTTNHKYEITGITHEKYPFLHRIRALRDVGGEVKSGDLGGFVESESNLSYEPGDDAWIFDDAIARSNAYVDRSSCPVPEVVWPASRTPSMRRSTPSLQVRLTWQENTGAPSQAWTQVKTVSSPRVETAASAG